MASGIQIFGLKNSQATRAAERFFKERRVEIHFVDLKQRPIAPGEIKRFIDKFGMPALLDSESKAYLEGGYKYLKLSDSEWHRRIEQNPQLLRLPLVRGTKLLSIGDDKDAWIAMLT